MRITDCQSASQPAACIRSWVPRIDPRILRALGTLVTCCLVFSLIPSTILAAEQPGNPGPLAKGQTAYVSVSRALIHSGPAEEFYPTGQLQQGTAVEVFHQTKNGWAAIRPPAGSFSWIPASEVFLLPGGRTAEVTSENSVSWIGTALGTAKQYRWQVRLNKGEQLNVLGEETIKDPDGREWLWYRIAPPSGEFRWIASGIISQTAPPPIASQGSKQAGNVLPAAATESQPAKKSSDVRNSRTSSSPNADNIQSSSTNSDRYLNSERQSSEVQGSEVQDEDGQPAEAEAEVQPAGYDSIIVHEGEGHAVIMDGEYVDGQIVDGEVVDGGVYYGEPIYEDEMMMASGPAPAADASWDDWQLFEFTDEGLRFPLWERSLNRQSQLHDPLLHDPFSLAMAPKAKGPRLGPALTEERHSAGHRRRTPWRDPRSLAEQRMQGFPQANGKPGNGTTLSALREAFNSPNSGSSSIGQPPEGNGGFSSSPDYYRDQPQPRQAPSLDQSSGFPSGPSAVLGFNADGLQPAGSFAGGLNNGVIDNHQGSSMNLAAGDAVGGNWLSRNWHGLQQQALSGGAQIIESGSAAVMQLQFQLNEIVTQPMMQWNFGSLKDQVQQMIQGGPSPVERGQARLLLERIEAFEQLASRSGYYLAGGSPMPGGQQPGYPANTAAPTLNHAVTTASFVTPMRDGFSARGSSSSTIQPRTNTEGVAASGRVSSGGQGLPFDATGWLVPVYATTAGQPSHAITDDSGRIVAYVTGLPGMNLDRYINQAIGIRGLRGFLPQLQTAHIEAQNVVRIR